MPQRVTDYIEKQPSPLKEICYALRNIILETFPDIKEEMKLGVPYYGGKYYIVALKNHVNLGFSITGMSAEEVALFTGGGKTFKVIEVTSVAGIARDHLVSLLKLVK